MIRKILALGLSNDKERIGLKTALCFGLTHKDMLLVSETGCHNLEVQILHVIDIFKGLTVL